MSFPYVPPDPPLLLHEQPPEDSVGYLLMRVRSEIIHALTQYTWPELQLTATQSGVLFMIASGRCTIAADVARIHGIDASAVTRLIDKLAQRGLITRKRSEQDKRVSRLLLTPAGKELSQRLPDIYAKVLDQLLQDFTPEEAGFLKSMLRRMLKNTNNVLSDVPGMQPVDS
ncbi:MAG: MarR family winged helix-turn-helix transcriptional regulator [Janthinobacterium lividum]